MPFSMIGKTWRANAAFAPASGNEGAGGRRSNRYNCVGSAPTCIIADIAGAFDAMIKALSYGNAGR
jgi:hypothetical protein